jgi:hypothetical protein
MYEKLKNSWKKFKAFYHSSAENRTQFHVFLGFMILPAIALASMFIYVFFFVIK